MCYNFCELVLIYINPAFVNYGQILYTCLTDDVTCVRRCEILNCDSRLSHLTACNMWTALIKRPTHLLFVLFQLLLQFLALALGMLNLLSHFYVLQVQLGELLLLGLDVLVELILFSSGVKLKVKIMEH